MKTLSKDVTSTFFIDDTGYQRLKEDWKGICHQPHPAFIHIAYLILLGRDYRKACTPITNKKTLLGGGTHVWGPRLAIDRLIRTASPTSTDRTSIQRALEETFPGILRDDVAMRIARLLPTLGSPYQARSMVLDEYQLHLEKAVA